MQLTLGEMLYRFRMEKAIEAKKVCCGICSPSALSKMESGQAVPDILLFECLVERMGISPEKFSVMVSQEERKYLEWRIRVCEAIETEAWKELGDLLQSDIVERTYCNFKLETQFFMYVSAIYNAQKGECRKATNLLESAAEQTIPEPTGIIESKVLLSSLELDILMLYMFYGIKGNLLSEQQGTRLFYILENYMSSNALAINEQVKCYPKLICLAVHSTKTLKEVEMEKYLKKAILICQKSKTFYHITELLRLYISLSQVKRGLEFDFYVKQYEVFCDLLKSEGISTSFNPFETGFSKAKYYIVQEYLSSKRKEMGLTQEILSEGICEPETYSRIESGKRSASRKNMQLLSERLGLSWCYYRGELNTSDPNAFDLRRKHRGAEIEGDRAESLKLILQLEKLLDMTCVENIQYIKANEYMLKYKLGMLDINVVCNKLMELLSLTQKTELDSSRIKYYSQVEVEIVGDIAVLLKKQGRVEDGIHIIIPVIKNTLNSQLNLEDQWNGFDYLLRILSDLYFENERYNLAYEIDNYVKRVKIRRREADTLTLVLDKIADDLEHMGERHRDEYMKLYRYTYYLSDFFNIGIAEAAKNYYESRFNENINWY